MRGSPYLGDGGLENEVGEWGRLRASGAHQDVDTRLLWSLEAKVDFEAVLLVRCDVGDIWKQTKDI